MGLEGWISEHSVKSKVSIMPSKSLRIVQVHVCVRVHNHNTYMHTTAHITMKTSLLVVLL